MKKALVLTLVAIMVLPLVSGCGNQRVAYFLYGTPTAMSTLTPTTTFTDTPTPTATATPTATPRPTRTPVPWSPAQEGWERTPQWDGEWGGGNFEAWGGAAMQLWISSHGADVRFLFDWRYGNDYTYDEQRLADTLMTLGVPATDVGTVLTVLHDADETIGYQSLESGWQYSIYRESDNHSTWYLSLVRPPQGQQRVQWTATSTPTRQSIYSPPTATRAPGGPPPSEPTFTLVPPEPTVPPTPTMCTLVEHRCDIGANSPCPPCPFGPWEAGGCNGVDGCARCDERSNLVPCD